MISVLTYGCETWNLSNSDSGRLHAAEMWFLCHMMWVSYTAHETNHSVMQRAGVRWYLVDKFRKRQAELFGHVMRKGSVERLAITGRLDGRRGRGPPRAFVHPESHKMGGSNSKGSRHHHGDGRQRNMVTDGIQCLDWAWTGPGLGKERQYIDTYIQTCIHRYIHTYIHTYTNTYIYIHTCIHTFVIYLATQVNSRH